MVDDPQVYELDVKDAEIIDLLRDGVISNSSIAEALGVSEGMVRQRIKRLRDQGILKLRGLINPEILAHRQVVWLGASVSETSLLDQKARQIAELDSVLSVSLVSGRYDLVIELLLDSHRGLVDFIVDKLSPIGGIKSTESFVTLKTYNKYV